MSASPAQLAANHANAQRSTGPRTPEGKAASARNALSHGIHASDDTILFAPNSPAATYLADFTAELAPASPAEAALVRQLALCTARMDLLDRALDAFPQLNQRRALIDCLQEQYDVLGPSAQLKDQPEWSAALRRYDGCPAVYPRDPDPATDPDLAACTLVYSLTSPRYARLLRQHAQAQRGFSAALRDLQHLQVARRRATPTYPPSTAHLEAISDLLDRGYQLLPPDHPLALSQNEPNPQTAPARTGRAYPIEQNEANSACTRPATCPADSILGRENKADCAPDPATTRGRENEPNPQPGSAPTDLAPSIAQNEANLASHPSCAGLPAIPKDPEGADLPDIPEELQNEANSGPIPSALVLPSPAPNLAVLGNSGALQGDIPARMPTVDRLWSGSCHGPLGPGASATGIALLDRLTRHAEQSISEAEWFAAACRAPAGGISVEDEVAALRALAKHVSRRHAPIPAPAR